MYQGKVYCVIKMLPSPTRKKRQFKSSLYNLEIGTDRHRQIGEVSVSTDIKQAKASRLKQLLELNAVREFERKRLARELHDRMGQDITALALGLRSLKKKLCVTHEATAQLEQLQMIVRQLSEQVHDIAWELRPLILDDLGLQAALQSLFEKWSVNTNINVNFQCRGLGKHALPGSVETGLYRITQEALTNISKHAEASNVLITLTGIEEQLVMMIADDGRGFDLSTVKSEIKNNKCFGVLGMRERVELFSGTFDIVSAPNNGTAVRISIPIYSQKKR